MKRFLLIMLCIIMCISPLVACSGGDDTTAEINTPETTYDYDKIPEVIEPHEEKVLTADELGLSAVITKTEKYWVADAKASTKTGEVTITSYNPGTTVITLTNSYSETVDVTVTVGLDYSIESVEFEKFEMPENYVIATDYGMSPTLADNAQKFQAAIDAVVAKGGGTVYVPKGVYKTTFVQLKSNVTIRLEGVLENYNTRFTGSLASKLLTGQFAVITAISGKGDIFANHPAKGWGREGADNFAIIGGAIDMVGQSRAFIWCCADGVLLENVIMKDCRNDHAIQITGSKNVTIRNCMFAGYNFTTGTGGNETIQIETSSSGAIGSGTVTASKFDEYEYITSANVEISNCYFGASDKCDSHNIPIGHHGHPTKPVVEGLKILNCTFDNPRVTAIRMFGYNNVELAHCDFISNRGNSAVGETRFMIELTFNTGDSKMSNGSYLALEADRGASSNLDIHDNTFTFGALSQMGGVLHTLKEGNTSCDAIAYYAKPICDDYKSKPVPFTGYKLMTNRTTNLKFYDNEITVEHKTGKNLFYLMSVKGLYMNNNTIESSIALANGKYDGGEVEGGFLMNCRSLDYVEKNFIVHATSGNKKAPLVLVGEEGNAEGFCTNSNPNNTVSVIFKSSEGGRIGRSTDEGGGALYIEPIADEGYRFDGYYVGDTRIEPGRFEFSANTNVELRFTAE